MVNTRILKEKFVPYKQIGANLWTISFSAIPEVSNILDEEGNLTGETEETGWIVCTMEQISGDLTPEAVRKVRIKELTEYDKSSDVNAFFFNGKQLWFDKITRTSIAYSMNMEKAAGAETTELYDNDNIKYTLPIDTAISIFGQVELYAKQCYNQTALHKVELNSLETVNELLAYDIKAGYPEKLQFNIG